MKDYSYPIDLDWTTSEMVEVVKLFELVENAYESKIDSTIFLDQYRKFQQIVGGKMHEKRLDKEFMDVSDYSIYEVYKKAQSGGIISMKK